MLFLNSVFYFGFCDGAGFYEVFETIVDFEVRDGSQKRWIFDLVANLILRFDRQLTLMYGAFLSEVYCTSVSTRVRLVIVELVRRYL